MPSAVVCALAILAQLIVPLAVAVHVRGGQTKAASCGGGGGGSRGGAADAEAAAAFRSAARVEPSFSPSLVASLTVAGNSDRVPVDPRYVLRAATRPCREGGTSPDLDAETSELVRWWQTEVPQGGPIYASTGTSACLLARGSATGNASSTLGLVSGLEPAKCGGVEPAPPSEALEFAVSGPLAEKAPTRWYLARKPRKGCHAHDPCPVILYVPGGGLWADFAEGVHSHKVQSSPQQIDTFLLQWAETDLHCAEALAAFVLIPMPLQSEDWCSSTSDLLTHFLLPLLQHHVKSSNVDPSRVHMLAFSLGGCAGMHAMLQHPQVFSHITFLSPFPIEAVDALLPDQAKWKRSDPPAPRQDWIDSLDFQRHGGENVGQAKQLTITIGVGGDDRGSTRIVYILSAMASAGMLPGVKVHARLYKGMGHIEALSAQWSWSAFYTTAWLWGEPDPPRLALPALQQKLYAAMVALLVVLAAAGPLSQRAGGLSRGKRTPLAQSAPPAGHRLRCAQELFDAQLQSAPDAVVAVFAATGESLTLAGMSKRAQVVAKILQHHEVHSDVLVPLVFERSMEMVVAIYGVLLAGGAYTPLDPAFSAARISLLLKDIRAFQAPGLVLLTTSQLLDEAWLGLCSHHLCVDSAAKLGDSDQPSPTVRAPSEPALTDLFSVIFTSGSTGRPKGVLLQQCGMLNHLSNHYSLPCQTCQDTVLFQRNYIFVSTAKELFRPLFGTSKLVIAKPGLIDFEYTVDLIRSYSVTTMYDVPTHAKLFLSHVRASGVELPSLRSLFLGGEACHAALCQSVFQALPDVVLHDTYGPTESSSDVTAFCCTKASLSQAKTIGDLQLGVQGAVVDSSLAAVLHGQTGELLLGGVQVARGYLNRPDATAEAFLDDFAPKPSSTVPRWYRTGDDVHVAPNGQLVFHGRRDHQVKIHGVRTELGEIEAALQEFPGVSEAVVLLVSEEERQFLVAFVSPRHIALAPELLHKSKELLPPSAVPSEIIGVDDMPRTASKKVDRAALRALSGRQQDKPGRQSEEQARQVRAFDSLGQVVYMSKAGLRRQQAHRVISALVALHLVWTHWLPHDGGVVISAHHPRVSFLVGGLTSFKGTWNALALSLGLADAAVPASSRREHQVRRIVNLGALYLLIGLPRWLAPSWQLATLHRWTCLAYIEVFTAGSACFTWACTSDRWCSERLMAAAAAVAVIAPWLRYKPLLPFAGRPDDQLVGSVWGVLLENFGYVDAASIARLLFFYLLGLYLHPVPGISQLATRKAVAAAAAAAAVAIHFAWVWLETSYDADAHEDWPAYYEGCLYPLRVLADACLAVLILLAALGESIFHRAAAFLGSFLVGTYLIHLYLFPDFPLTLEVVAHFGGAGALLVALFLIPPLYVLSVGRLMQALFGGLQRALSSLHGGA